MLAVSLRSLSKHGTRKAPYILLAQGVDHSTAFPLNVTRLPTRLSLGTKSIFTPSGAVQVISTALSLSDQATVSGPRTVANVPLAQVRLFRRGLIWIACAPGAVAWMPRMILGRK